MLELSTRLEVNALLDRILTDEPTTFRAVDARRLVAIVPRQPGRSWLTFRMRSTDRGRSGSGYSPGVGNVTLGEDGQQRELTVRGDVIWRVGGWKVTFAGRTMEIIRAMDDEFLDDEARIAQLCFDRGMQPEALLMSARRTLTIPLPLIGGVSLGFTGYRPWKVPI